MRRLTFLVKNGAVELLSEQHVDMKRLEQPPVAPGATHPFWLELRSSTDQTLASHPVSDPTVAEIEVFSEDAEQNIKRLPHERAENAFSVVLPDVVGADSVVLMRAPAARSGGDPVALRAGGVTPATTEVARFKLSSSQGR